MEHREGVGENREQLMMSISTLLASTLVLSSTFATQSNITASASFLAPLTDRSAGSPSKQRKILGGHAV